MLSTENPPADPPCLPCEIPQLKSSSDERASYKRALPEADLLNPPLDHRHTPLPKFSIRDYVFTARSKGIKKNWPFSLKNLQLCLKHGVKDILPPFQSLDSVRNQFFKRCVVETSSLEKEDIRNFDGEPSGFNNLVELDSFDNAQPDQKLAEACVDESSCRSGGENDYPSITRSNTQSEIESVPTNSLSSSQLETDTLLEASVEVEATAAPVLQKTKSTTRPLVKKCRLIVKFGSSSDRSSVEDIASNCTTLSETMASKTCPVCKTFSSPSNTTLNAHIDQCLSAESTPGWMADSKLTRHRIKPRKTRLMVDIYTTALRCTLEELDRRNGSSWATLSSLPSQVTDMSVEGKKQRVSPVHPEDTDDVGAVYIDANGTKLRILSKSNDAPSVSKVEEDLGPRKLLKGGKGSKFFYTKKKRRNGQNDHKYLKLAPQSKKFRSLNAHGSQICGEQGKFNRAEESRKDCQLQKFKSQEHGKPSDSGTLRQWVCSKRTDLSKKVTGKDVNQPLKCKLHVTQDLLVDSNQSCLGDSLVDRSHEQRFPVSSENPISPPDESERMDNSFYEGRVSDKREWSPGGKKRSPLAVASTVDDMDRSLPPLKRKVNQLGKNITSVHDGRILKLPNSNVGRVSLLSNKTVEINAGPVNNSIIPPGASSKLSKSCHSFSSKAMRFSTSGENVLSVSQSSARKSKFNVTKKCSILKKSQVHFKAEMNEEVVTWHSVVDQQYDLMLNCAKNQSGREESSDDVSLGRNSLLETRQERGATAISPRKEALALKCSQSTSQFYGHDDVGKNIYFSVGFGDDFPGEFDGLESARKESQILGDDIISGPSSKLALGGHLSKPLDPEFQKLAPSKAWPNSIQSIEDYKGPLCGAEAATGPSDPNFVDVQNMFCVDEIGNNINEETAHIGAEFDSEGGQGNSFPDVDPIPIPGPPGSFLPSPGDMDSEDFQGNLSLSTSLGQSTQEQHDLDDEDSSDSPISATSTISNSMAARSDVNCSEPLISVGSSATHDKIRLGFSDAGTETSIENTGTVSQATSPRTERVALNGDNFGINEISIEKRPLSFKNNDLPCCCQRKERISPAVAFNYQESQLLRRRAITSVVPATGKQMGCNLIKKPNHLEVRPEIFPLRSCPSSGSEKVFPSVMKSPSSPIPLNNPPDAGVKVLGHGDGEFASPSPSASNPVLRLMGKNLMVVKKDEDALVSLGQAQPSSQNNHLAPQFPTFSGVSPANIQNQDRCSFHHMVPQGSVIFGQDPHNTVGQCFDIRLSNNFRSHLNSNSPQTPARVPEGMLPNQCMGGGFAAFMEPPDCQNRQKNRLNAASTRNLERVMTTPDQQCKNTDSTANPAKEIIIIDDVPESEANMITNVAKYSGGLRECKVVSSGILIPTVPSYDMRHVNSFSCYQLQDPPPLGELPMVQNTSFPASHSRQANTSPVRWSCTSEGSTMLQRSPFIAASSSTCHLKSALYYSPSLS